MTTQLSQVQSRWFTAGIEVEGRRIVTAAPILRKAWLNRPLTSLEAWARREGWQITEVKP